jgi:hypothetical protein
MKRCIVFGCENHKHEGRFEGDMCMPCYRMITTGKYNVSYAWFIKEIDNLKIKLQTATEG